MKATGIVRRIDDLGRVVIPKEIRRTMRIREGEPLEIYTDRDGEVIFKKYSPVGELSVLAGGCAEALSRTAGCPVVICDRDVVIVAVGGARKELEGKVISPAFEAQMEERQALVRGSGERPAPIVEGIPRSEPWPPRPSYQMETSSARWRCSATCRAARWSSSLPWLRRPFSPSSLNPRFFAKTDRFSAKTSCKIKKSVLYYFGKMNNDGNRKEWAARPLLSL